MDLEIVILNEVSQRMRNIICHRFYVEPLKNDVYELIYKTETDAKT